MDELSKFKPVCIELFENFAWKEILSVKVK
jgi:hypothetical protein